MRLIDADKLYEELEEIYIEKNEEGALNSMFAASVILDVMNKHLRKQPTIGMSVAWNRITDGLPPVGVPLIVTVKDGLQGKPNTLRYPVYYEKAKDGNGYRWSWRFGDYDYDLIPEVSEVVGWMEMPKPLEEDKG